MAKVREIYELADFIRTISGKSRKATMRALLRTATAASAQAKRNARDNFKGSKDRPKQGFLVNAIFAGFTMKGSGESKQLAESFVAVKSRKGNVGTRPYGRIQEYGGEIEPVKAKSLWIPMTGPKSTGDAAPFKNLSPSDFMRNMKAQQKGKQSGFKYRKSGGRAKTLKGVVKLARRNLKVRAVKGEFAIFGGMAWFVKKIGGGKRMREKFIALFALRQRVFIPARPYVRPAVEQEWAKFKERLDKELSRGKKQTNGGETPPTTTGA